MIDYEDFINHKSFWFQKDGNYIFDKDWSIKMHNPAIYKAFEWMEVHRFRTPVHYFSIHLRRHTNGTILKSLIRGKNSKYTKRYSVIIKVAQAGIPLPINSWEEDGKSPWQLHNSYIDVFHGGKKYKNYFEEEYSKPQSKGTPSSLLTGFEEIDEARSFLEYWKKKLLIDFDTDLENDKNIFKYIKNKILEPQYS